MGRIEKVLREVLKEEKLNFYEAKGEAAFYGPKLDVQVKSAIGHDVTLSTIQLDYQLPERFELEYINEEGNKARPVVIHRAILGSLDRFIAFILEEFKGVLPLWLAPMGVEIIPVNTEFHTEYAKKVLEALKEAGIKAEVDDRFEKLGYRVREAQSKKIPYNVILGDNERDNNLVSYRLFGEKETTTLPLEEFVEVLKKEIKNKTRKDK